MRQEIGEPNSLMNYWFTLANYQFTYYVIVLNVLNEYFLVCLTQSNLQNEGF